MRAGTLRHRVTIQQLSADTKDADGRPAGSWQDVATVWAAVEPLRGREFWEAAAQQSEVTIRVRIRYRAGITAAMRVKFGDRLLEIVHSINVDERNRELHLMCREVTPGG